MIVKFPAQRNTRKLRDGLNSHQICHLPTIYPANLHYSSAFITLTVFLFQHNHLFQSTSPSPPHNTPSHFQLPCQMENIQTCNTKGFKNLGLKCLLMYKIITVRAYHISISQKHSLENSKTVKWSQCYNLQVQIVSAYLHFMQLELLS